MPRENDNPEPQYTDYVNMIRQEAWKRVKRNPLVDFEELVSLGSLAFNKAVETWKPTKGKFSTHLWWQLKDQMGRVQSYQDYESLDNPETTQVADDKPGPFEETKFRSGVTSLSQEGMEVVYLVLNCPWELVDWTIRWVRPCQGSIREFLRSRGWPGSKIDKAFTEIKSMLAEL